MTPRIDAHQHFWQRSLPFDYTWQETPEHQPICRDFLPEDLQPQLAAAGIEKSIFVQTQHNLDENRWTLSLCEENAFLAGIVGWVDLASEDCEAQVEEFAADPKFLGVRHITQDEPDDNFIVRADVVRGLKVLEKHGVPFDLLFFAKHLKHAATLAAELPNLPLVIDHLAKPNIAAGGWEDWLPHLQAAAKHPNVYCKLSGLITEADWQNWQPADLQPYVDAALEAFGADRCMYGSDWPVCVLAGSYADVYGALSDCLESVSDSERDAIFGGTAAKFYGI